MTTLLPDSERQVADPHYGADEVSLRGGQKELLVFVEQRTSSENRWV
jgi:hypothetical protein